MFFPISNVSGHLSSIFKAFFKYQNRNFIFFEKLQIIIWESYSINFSINFLRDILVKTNKNMDFETIFLTIWTFFWLRYLYRYDNFDDISKMSLTSLQFLYFKL